MALTEFPSECHTACYQNKKPVNLEADSLHCVTSALAHTARPSAAPCAGDPCLRAAPGRSQCHPFSVWAQGARGGSGSAAHPHAVSSPPAAVLVPSVPAAAGRSTPVIGCGGRAAMPTTWPASPASPARGSSPRARSSAWWRRRCCAGSTMTP